MGKIQVLDSSTIDKIAAGEVVERPASVVKELVENAMDAGATAITVEIKDGGIEFIRVTDNGIGIEREQVREAFLRHATSKITSVADLLSLQSMGFRGEALSSISAVSKVEIVTKTKDALSATRLCIEGAKETAFDDIGAPDGTTIIVRNLFFNTPARRKFLKTAMTEGSYITDLLEHMALSRPEISFKYVINGQTKFYTNGDGDLKAIIYRIFGRDITNEVMEFQFVEEDLVLEGYLGKPTLNRANRNFENYFLNKRYIKSKIISNAIEEGYQPYVMQHRYPFCVLHITMPTESVDVNVHPTKMEVRFANQNTVYKHIADGISQFLARQEMIPKASLGAEEKAPKAPEPKITAPEPFEVSRKAPAASESFEASRKAPAASILREEGSYAHKDKASVHEDVGQFMFNNKVAYENGDADKAIETQSENPKSDTSGDNFFVDTRTNEVKEPVNVTPQNSLLNKILSSPKEPTVDNTGILKAKDHIFIEKPEQLNFFDEKILTREARQEYRIVGEVFDTYWIIEYRNKMLMIDQHAAHEKVKYERILKQVERGEVFTQYLTPPVVIAVTPKEAEIIKGYDTYFKELGFDIEDFGMNAFAIRGIPMDLFGHDVKELFDEILTQMIETPVRGVPQVIKEKIASMACKAAVKGNNTLSLEEADELINELLELDNPYNCPHGRPTIIAMSKYEIEKKFKRIV